MINNFNKTWKELSKDERDYLLEDSFNLEEVPKTTVKNADFLDGYLESAYNRGKYQDVIDVLIKYIRPELKSANTSYMLIAGCSKDNYNELKEELDPYELEDLLNSKRYYSLNLIKANNGYSKFITKLPPLK